MSSDRQFKFFKVDVDRHGVTVDVHLVGHGHIGYVRKWYSLFEPLGPGGEKVAVTCYERRVDAAHRLADLAEEVIA